MISYEPLLIQLVKRKMTREALRVAVGASPSSIARFAKNEYVSLELIDKICAFLHCRIEDVIEYIPDDSTDSPKP